MSFSYLLTCSNHNQQLRVRKALFLFYLYIYYHVFIQVLKVGHLLTWVALLLVHGNKHSETIGVWVDGWNSGKGFEKEEDKDSSPSWRLLDDQERKKNPKSLCRRPAYSIWSSSLYDLLYFSKAPYELKWISIHWRETRFRHNVLLYMKYRHIRYFFLSQIRLIQTIYHYSPTL